MTTATEWGPSAWKFLHTVTYAFPDSPTLQEQTQAENLFHSLRLLLPCERCREHYEEEISQNPPNAASKATLSSWLVQVHNKVNSRLGKPLFTQQLADETYTSLCSLDCTSQTSQSQTSQTSQSSSQSAQRTSEKRSKKREIVEQTMNSLYALMTLLVIFSIILFWMKNNKK